LKNILLKVTSLKHWEVQFIKKTNPKKINSISFKTLEKCGMSNSNSALIWMEATKLVLSRTTLKPTLVQERGLVFMVGDDTPCLVHSDDTVFKVHEARDTTVLNKEESEVPFKKPKSLKSELTRHASEGNLTGVMDVLSKECNATWVNMALCCSCSSNHPDVLYYLIDLAREYNYNINLHELMERAFKAGNANLVRALQKEFPTTYFHYSDLILIAKRRKNSECEEIAREVIRKREDKVVVKYN
jgi:hypothetical protein